MESVLTSTPSFLISLQNTTSWGHLKALGANLPHYAPSFRDILLAGPRIAVNVASLITGTDAGAHPNPAIIDATILRPADTNLRNIMDPEVVEEASSRVSRLSLDSARGFGSVFSYATSKWALACVAMAIILNRTHIYAATRRRLRFRWTIRLLLRFLPIILIAGQSVRLLQSIQCQTSPDFAELRWGDASKGSDLMFSHENKFLNRLAALLLGSTDEASCLAVSMTPPEDGSSHDLRGSLSRLWPLFGTFCLSHFIETVSNAAQGRAHAYETAMTLFEHSLAFAEADAAVSNQIGWGSLSKGQPSTMTGTSIALTRSMILRRVNTAPEVLFIALLSAMTHLSSHMLGVLDLQARYRLANTGFWALCFMGTLVWQGVIFDIDDPSSQGLLRFPTVSIIGLIPHMLVLAGIIICFAIYGFGVLLSALSPPDYQPGSRMTFRERISLAHQNMQANILIAEIRVTREMDVYTALLRTGFAAVTMASEAVYLNEDRGVNLKHRTWLEEARLQEAEEMQRHWTGLGITNSRWDNVGSIGLVPVNNGPPIASNGYARERAAQKSTKGREKGIRVGRVASERNTRRLMAVEFFLSMNKLLARIGAILVLWMMSVARIRSKPVWLLALARRFKDDGASKQVAIDSADEHPLARPEGLDIEAEFRRAAPEVDKETFDSELYKYWISGGWWGSNDESGEFQPSEPDNWDTTSICTESTTCDVDEWESEDEGQRTPTQRSPRISRSWDVDAQDDESTHMDHPFSMGDLARLLQPKSPEERADARNLAAHFKSDRILTRSQYRRMEQLDRTRILTTSRIRNSKLSPDEEEGLLEQLILSRRQADASQDDTANTSTGSWKDGGAGMGSEGPQCVVCQSSPRSVIVWPCRCLSLCDDCRVSLAMNNFDKCVCCRREVISFSRIFVP